MEIFPENLSGESHRCKAPRHRFGQFGREGKVGSDSASEFHPRQSAHPVALGRHIGQAARRGHGQRAQLARFDIFDRLKRHAEHDLQLSAEQIGSGGSRDGFIMWARSSKRALRTGAFYRTSGPPVPLPAESLAGRADRLVDGRTGIGLPAGVWLREDVREVTIFADQYDFAISLLMLSNDAPAWQNEEPVEDVYDRLAARSLQ
jgi:hypothetical protein